MIQVLQERDLKSTEMKCMEGGNKTLEVVTVNCLSMLDVDPGFI